MSKIIIIAISLLGILVFANLALLPHYQDLKIVQVKTVEKQAELISKEKYFSQIESLSQELKNYPDELSKIEFSVPDSPRLPDFFEFLQKTCSEKGLILANIKSFETRPTPKGEKTRETIIVFEVSGSFESLVNFLKTLEKSARMIEVLNISFSTPKTEGGPFAFEIKLKINSY